jgi:hypothetical protein
MKIVFITSLKIIRRGTFAKQGRLIKVDVGVNAARLYSGHQDLAMLIVGLTNHHITSFSVYCLDARLG